MVVFDASTLIALLRPRSSSDDAARLLAVIAELKKAGDKVAIPTPALSELLAGAGRASGEYLASIRASSVYRVVNFDQKAAIECARIVVDAQRTGDKRGGAKGTWAKIKFDQQIVAIALVVGAHTVYSEDDHVRSLAVKYRMNAVKIGDLPLPPEAAQQKLDLKH